jgi:hypothetical protein
LNMALLRAESQWTPLRHPQFFNRQLLLPP